MPSRYLISAKYIPEAGFESLRESIKNAVFLTTDVPSSKQTLNVMLHDKQTMNDLISAYPILKDCHIAMIK